MAMHTCLRSAYCLLAYRLPAFRAGARTLRDNFYVREIALRPQTYNVAQSDKMARRQNGDERTCL
jgi:hypothetical protein